MAAKKPNNFKASDAIATQPKTGHYAEWANATELLIDILGLSQAEMEEVHIEALRCRGNDLKERRFMRRIYRLETVFDGDGYFIEFYAASSPSIGLIATMGPFDSKEHSEEAYDCLIEHFKFDKGLIINKPDEDPFEDLFSAPDEDDDEFEGLFDDIDDVFDFDKDDDPFDFEDDDEPEGLWD